MLYPQSITELTLGLLRKRKYHPNLSPTNMEVWIIMVKVFTKWNLKMNMEQ